MKIIYIPPALKIKNENYFNFIWTKNIRHNLELDYYACGQRDSNSHENISLGPQPSLATNFSMAACASDYVNDNSKSS